MLLHRRRILEGGRFLLILRCVGNDPARFFLPLIDQNGVAGDLDAAPVFLKTHPPAESLLVESVDDFLESMIVGRPEQPSRKPATGYGSEIPFNLFFLNDFARIKVIFFLTESDTFKGGHLHRYGSVIRKLVDHNGIV